MGKKRYLTLPADPQVRVCECGAEMVFVQVPKAHGRLGELSWMPLSLRTAIVRGGVRMAEPHFGDCPIWAARRRKQGEERAKRKPRRLRPWTV